MVQSEVSGVIFSIDPVNTIKIKLYRIGLGLGEMIVQGSVTPTGTLYKKKLFDSFEGNFRQSVQLIKEGTETKEGRPRKTR